VETIDSIRTVAEIVEDFAQGYDAALRDLNAGDEILDERAAG
jgi:hypothetical protein